MKTFQLKITETLILYLLSGRQATIQFDEENSLDITLGEMNLETVQAAVQKLELDRASARTDKSLV